METVLTSEPNAIAILPRDVAEELFKGGVAALSHRLNWKLPPVTFFCLRQFAEQPQMRALATALRNREQFQRVRAPLLRGPVPKPVRQW